jgi:uncharacterized protein
MLTATFCHAPGIGPGTEQKLWTEGIRSWDDALSCESLPLTPMKAEALIPTVEASKDAFERNDWRWLAKNIPAREHWRAAKLLMERVAFLDIETDGGFEGDSVTVIGLYDGFESQLFVQGQNLEEFPAAMAGKELLVTFFGTGFDLPMLRRRFPELPFDQLHIDLCPALRRLGYTGGLKKIERILGISRDFEIEDMSGMDAVYLWQAWKRHKSQEALDRLLAYNRADIENLALLLAFAHPRLEAASGYHPTVEKHGN